MEAFGCRDGAVDEVTCFTSTLQPVGRGRCYELPSYSQSGPPPIMTVIVRQGPSTLKFAKPQRPLRGRIRE
jgi:hypothetical protein